MEHKAASEPTWDSQPCWIHALNACQYRPGGVFGWVDHKSPTGFLSGIVVEADAAGFRVYVRDVMLGVMTLAGSTP